jgi:ribokinase
MGEVEMNERNAKVVVVGSFNMDLVVKAGRRPQTGETFMGEEFGMFIGGKGSNQAIAAARLGADVTMIGKLGTDLFGDTLMAAHAEEGIHTDYVIRDTEVGTGIASILIDADGDNSIVIVPQANMRLSVEDIERASESIAAADVLLLQLEVPIAASQRAAEIAKSNGATVVLNPAPAQELPDDFLAQVDILTPNAVETESLSGVKVSTATDAERAAKVLLDKGLSAVILTLGERGALLLTSDLTQQVPAYSVEVVDTTAAGDAFCGALATGLARGENLVDAVAFANAAGALAVTVLGAAPSMPTATQVEAFCGGHNKVQC